MADTDEEIEDRLVPEKKKSKKDSSIIQLPDLGGIDRQLDDSDGSFQGE